MRTTSNRHVTAQSELYKKKEDRMSQVLCVGKKVGRQLTMHIGLPVMAPFDPDNKHFSTTVMIKRTSTMEFVVTEQNFTDNRN
jgi:hypothetical protein